MSCPNCGSGVFVASEYKMQYRRAPALECATCHILHLDEEAVASKEDRDSVRLAVAARAHVYATLADSPPAATGL
jgi:ribosomal protein S27AE